MDRSLSSLPHVNTERLRLRPLELADAEAFRAMTDEPGILNMVHFLSQPFGLADAEKLLIGDSDGRDCFWGVWYGSDPTLIGSVGTHSRGTSDIEIGYWFVTAMHGQGLASEAVRAMASALTAAYPTRVIVAECRPQNGASWRLLERVGFRADGADGARPGR